VAHSPIILPAGVSTPRPSIDFETYSEAGFTLGFDGKVRGVGPQGKGGLPVVGAPAYAEHHSTEVLVARYDLKAGAGLRQWLPTDPPPQDLLDHVKAGGMLAAWNAAFEWYIWNFVCTRRYGWPPLPLEQCLCDMAKSRRYSLPGSLDNAAKVIGGQLKDSRGKALIQKLTRPHTPTKNRPAPRWTASTAPEDYSALYDYCGQDVISEDNAAAHTPDLSPAELEVWRADQRVNARGVQVDTVALGNCLAVLGQAERRFTQELAALTGGAVGSVSETAKMGDWLASRGCGLPNLQAETVQDALDGKLFPLTEECRRALEIRALLGSSNVKKLRTLALQVNSDGRLRDQYTYCGADRTGRWSAGGVQLQNITAKGPKTAECEGCGKVFGRDGEGVGCPRCGAWMVRELPEWDVQAAQQAIDDMAHRDLDMILRVWGDAVAVLCGCLRALFVAKPGHDLVCVDYSAIEAVVAACISRCQWRIDAFAAGKDIYLESISRITRTPYAVYEQHRQATGSHHPDRKRGKVAELASGFGGWVGAWLAFGAGDLMNEDEIKDAILAWRDASPEIVDMWGGQFRWCGPGKWDYRAELHGLEGAAIQAVMFPGSPFECNDITYVVHDEVLWCVLPSGRRLYYHRPRLVPAEDKLRRGPAWSLTFEGYNSNATKGPVGWHRMETYGGRLFENVVQAIARDILAAGLVRCEANGYPVVMHTHDELVAEVPESTGSVGHMTALLIERLPWCSWWPIRAAGWRHKRYQKD